MTTKEVWPKAVVTIDGSDSAPLSAETTLSLRSPVSIASVKMDPLAAGPFDGTEIVVVSMGDQTGVVQEFAGKLNTDAESYGAKTLSFTAQGDLYLTQEPTGIVDPTAEPADTDPEAPPYQGPTFARKWVEKTDGQIITDILSVLYGLTNIEIADSGTIFGSIEPVRLRSDEPGWSLIEELDAITGYKTFVGPDGVITRIEYSGLPSATAAYQLTEGDNIRNITRERSTGKVYNVVTVNGKSGIQTPSGEYYSITATRTGGTSPYIPTPPGTRMYTFSSDLIETEVLAGACAARLLANLNRRTENITAVVTPGNKFLRPGMTVGVDASSVELDSATMSRIIEVRQAYGNDYTTQLILEGSLAGEGTDPNQKPIAFLSYAIETERTTAGSAWIVMLDASASYDPDGTIVDYIWTTDLGTGVINVLGDGSIATLVIIGAWPTPNPTVTLQVTDNHGKIASKTVTLIPTKKNTYQRDLWAAVSSDLLFSNDGQNNWVAFGIAATIIPEEAGDAYQLAATSGGVLYRALVDGTKTTPTIGASVQSLCISRDRNGTETEVAWAGCTNGSVWRSPDQGVTWFQMGVIEAGVPVYSISESPFSPGDMYATCGRTIVHSYDAGVHWEILYAHPNTDVIALRQASGIAADNTNTHWAAFYGPDVTADASHIIEAQNTIHLDTDVPANKPLRFTGLTITLDAERLLLTDIAADGTGRAWAGTATVSGNLTKKTPFSDTLYGHPAHIIRDGKFPVIWGISDSQIWKSPTEFGTFLTVKNLISGQVGKMIGYGRLHPPIVISGALYYIGYSGTQGGEYKLIELSGAGWRVVGNVPAIPRFADSRDLYRMYRLASGTLIFWYNHSTLFGAYRSADNGVTWDTITPQQIFSFTECDDGTIYIYADRGPSLPAGGGFDRHEATLYKSTDDGASWTAIRNFNFDAFDAAQVTRVVADTQDSTVVMYQHFGHVAVSTDGGLTFGAEDSSANRMDGNGGADYPFFARNNRHMQSVGIAAGGGTAIEKTIRGGTIAPLTMGVLPAATTSPEVGLTEFIPLGNNKIYGIGLGARVWTSADDGATWTNETSIFFGPYGMAHDSENEDIYCVYAGFSGIGSSGTLSGMITKHAGGGSIVIDLTQSQYDQLGAVYIPYQFTAVK